MRNQFLIFAMAFFLTGCIGLNQKIVVSNNQSMSYQLDYVLNANLFSMQSNLASSTKEDQEIDPVTTCDEFLNKNQTQTIPKALSVEYLSSFKDKDLVCSYIFNGPVSEFTDLDISGVQPENKASIFIFEILSDNQAKISTKLDFAELRESMRTEDETNEEFEKAMITAMFFDKFIRWELTAPKILETNGELSEDGKTVNWELPMYLGLLEKGNYEFFAVVQY